ncbi:MAG: hypothetical protein JWN18_465 [Parcubacteria group bacterium]|nr:hypothetical protein [Parcubacteria group bacterium]
MKRLTFKDSGLTRAEYDTLKKLSTPAKIQDYLDTLAFNYEKKGETHMSPMRVMREGKAHCIEGAMLAAAALWIVGEPPLVMNLSPKMGKGDFDHVVTLFKRNSLYGAISKTNHSVLRYRDPIFDTPRDLALSYFHEWFLPTNGEKVLECYSDPFDLSKLDASWVAAEEDSWQVSNILSETDHYYCIPPRDWRGIRPVDPIELKAASTPEWIQTNRRP